MKSWGKKVCLHRNWCELGSDLGKPLKFTGILHDNLGSWRKLSQGQKWTQFLSKEILTWVKKCLGTKPELTLEMEALELCRCTQVTEDLTPLQDWGGGLGSWGQKLPCTISPQPALTGSLHSSVLLSFTVGAWLEFLCVDSAALCLVHLTYACANYLYCSLTLQVGLLWLGFCLHVSHYSAN